MTAAGALVWQLRGVGHRYGDDRVLDSVDLDVRAGERVAVLGPSGAGKSTLLRVASGALDPVDGEVALFGTPLAGLAPRARRAVQRRVGSLSQDLDLVEQVRVLHNVNAGRLASWSAPRALASLVSTRADLTATTALEQVGLGWAVHARTEQLSGGERQRVALARLLVAEVDAVVADEPVSSLDPATSVEVLRLVCSSTGTALVSLHQPELARGHFTRMVGLRGGRVCLDLPASELTADHLDQLYERS